MKIQLLMLLGIGPLFGFILQSASPPPGYELVSSWVQYGPLGLTAITAIIVCVMLIKWNISEKKQADARYDALVVSSTKRLEDAMNAGTARLDQVNRDFVARLDEYQRGWRESVERITREHRESIEKGNEELSEIILANTAELSKSTETRGHSIQVINRMEAMAMCPYADRNQPQVRAK